ncbi:MAG: hypothetical protein NWE99_05780 [Candidatus Bathyarchaeota archaeon]|nr:hypothetical protein [Candidatus Bathyarchaeota archaeon]
MNKLLRNRLALSTVVTTLIILVVSVLLATVVVYYATNVVSTRVQEESLHLTKQHVWYDPVNGGQAAIMIINTGGRDVVLDKISVRGQESPWAKVCYNITTGAISADLTYNSSSTLGAGDISIGGTSYAFSAASTDLILKSGYTVIIYIDDPDSISINDVGLTVSIAIYTSNAVHYQEANVEATVMP